MIFGRVVCQTRVESKAKLNLRLDMNSTLRGMLYMLAATIFFALMNAMVKYAGQLGYPSMENIFFRAFFMMLSMFCVFFATALQPLVANKLQAPRVCRKKTRWI